MVKKPKSKVNRTATQNLVESDYVHTDSMTAIVVFITDLLVQSGPGVVMQPVRERFQATNDVGRSPGRTATSGVIGVIKAIPVVFYEIRCIGGKFKLLTFLS